MKSFLSIVATSLSLAFGVSIASAYVSPGAPTGYVNDYTGTLSAETEASLEDLLQRFAASGKGEIAVAVISTLGGDAIENYSIELAREWGIGMEGEDNGVLLLIAKEDREMRIEVGYGFEGVLTDAKSSRIIRDVIAPRFKAGQYDEGVSLGTQAILGTLDPAFEGGIALTDVAPESNTPRGGFFSFPVVAAILYFAVSILSFIASILGRTKSWWFGGVIGAVFGGVVSVTFDFGVMPVVIITLVGLFFDFIVSHRYQKSIVSGATPPWWTGGSSGGFGGGSFGGGGSSGRW